MLEREAEKAAAYLIGKTLCCRKADGSIMAYTIVETEAYPHADTACYGYGYAGNFGDRAKTAANAPLFESGGRWCVYGGMLLVVCGTAGLPDNVLIRGIAGETEYADGPIGVAALLGVDRHLNGQSVWDTAGGVWLLEEGEERSVCRTVRRRLGKDVSDEDRKQLLRFCLR